MTSEHIETLLAQAGVDAGAVGAAERLLLPEPQVDEARTARVGGLVPPALLRVRSDALAAVGIDAGFDEDARTLILSAAEDLPFTLVGRAERAATVASIALGAPLTFLVGCDAGPLAVGTVDARAIELRDVHAWPAPAFLNDSGVKSNSGVVDQPNDSGVVQRHSGVVRQHSRWDQTVAAGRVARGVEPDATPADAISARRWLRGVTADQRALIERFAIVRARGVAGQLARIQDGQGVDQSLDFAWQGICWGRDDVEGIRVLLREAQAGQVLAAALRAVDELGRAVRFSWPSEVDVHDDRLQRVSEADPGAWWGSTRRQVVWL